MVVNVVTARGAGEKDKKLQSAKVAVCWKPESKTQYLHTGNDHLCIACKPNAFQIENGDVWGIWVSSWSSLENSRIEELEEDPNWIKVSYRLR